MFSLKKFPIILLLLLLVSSCSKETQNKSILLNSSNSAEQNPMVSQKANPKLLQEVNQELAKINACEGQIDPTVSNTNSSVYPINQKEYLVEFLCFLGAYQGNYEYFLYEDVGARPKITPLSLPILELDKSGKVTQSDTRSIGGLPEYNADQKTLTVVTKYRGLGDCGSLAKYKWEDKEFKILEYRIKKSCDGTYLEPEQYSRVYP